MRLTFILWTATLVFGLATYYVWYLRTAEAVTLDEVQDLAQVSAPVEAGAPPPPRRVSLQNFAFEPADLTVVAGTKLIWVNQDGAPHNVTFDDGSVASDDYFQGEAFEHTFRALGDFQMFCTLHGSPGGVGMAAVVRVVDASDDNLEQIAAQPSLEVVPPAPTPAPPVPPAPVAFIEESAPADVVAGVVAFRDNIFASDTAVVALANIPAPAAGAAYHAWLTRADGGALDIGAVAPDATGAIAYTYTDPTGQNLLASYDGFLITQEPEFDDDPSPGEVVFSGRTAPQSLALIRTVTVSAPDTPGNLPYAFGARLQTEEVIRHVEFIRLALELGSIADAQRHAEHVVNIIEGANGALFGDIDGEHGVQNPGDGFGLLSYIRSMTSAATSAGDTTDATVAIRYHAEHVAMSSANAIEWASAVRDAALQVAETARVGDIAAHVETLGRFSQLLLNGQDNDGNGQVEPPEGGIWTAYQHAQYMAAIGVLAGSSQAVVDAQPILEQGVEQQIAAGEIVIEMLDFEFRPAVLSAPAGTVVRFVNVGKAPHSATADNDQWDSGLLEPGQEFTFTIEDPAAYAYYCILHGLPGGNGMAGAITGNP
jgi:plastocyanin